MSAFDFVLNISGNFFENKVTLTKRQISIISQQIQYVTNV